MDRDRELKSWELDLKLFREVFRDAQKPRKIDIMVVEDCDEDFFLITRCLNAMRDYDVAVTRAVNLETAARLFNSTTFDLVIVDYWLGEDTGPHVLHKFGGRNGKIPAILVTGLDHPVYKDAALRAGAIQCISKDLLTGTILQDTISGVLLTHKIESGMLHGSA